MKKLNLLLLIKSKLLIFLSKKRIKEDISFYKNKFTSFCADTDEYYGQRKMRREIIILSHVIEKGLSHDSYKPGFGKDRIERLCNYMERYSANENCDKFAVENAEILLGIYHDYNYKNGYDDSSFLHKSIIKSDDNSLDSIFLDSVENSNNRIINEFAKIAKSRHSVRIWSERGEPISDDMLEEIVDIAQTAPSACNRQPIHLYIVRDKEKLQTIENIQMGCKGFGQNASMMIFIVSDLSLYGSGEIKLPIFDAGIYAMNLLYALHSYGLYACILNASFSGRKQQKAIHELVGVSNGKDINGLIAVYKLPENVRIKIPVSPRRKSQEVIHYV